MNNISFQAFQESDNIPSNANLSKLNISNTPVCTASSSLKKKETSNIISIPLNIYSNYTNSDSQELKTDQNSLAKHSTPNSQNIPNIASNAIKSSLNASNSNFVKLINQKIQLASSTSNPSTGAMDPKTSNSNNTNNPNTSNNNISMNEQIILLSQLANNAALIQSMNMLNSANCNNLNNANANSHNVNIQHQQQQNRILFPLNSPNFMANNNTLNNMNFNLQNVMPMMVNKGNFMNMNANINNVNNLQKANVPLHPSMQGNVGKSHTLFSSNFLHLLNKNYIDSKLSSMAHVKILNSPYRNSIIPVVPEIFSKSKNLDK